MLILDQEPTTAVASVAPDTPSTAHRLAATVPIILIVAHLPLLAFYGWMTWEKPHYRFFPLVPVGAAWLAYRAAGMLGQVEPGRARLASTMLWACWTLLAVACLLVSPWLGAVASLLTVGAVAYALGGTKLVRAILPAWAFLGLVITPPVTLDLQFVTALQSGATRFSCRILDLLRVYHVRDGNVIRLADRTLLVEEACSGVHSLFAVLAGTFFYAAWARRSILRGVVLVASAVLWVTVGNALRIVAVAALAAWWGVDVASGWPHEALGLVIFAVALGLAASTESWFALIADERALRRARELRRKGRLDEDEGDSTPEPDPIRLPSLARTRLGSRPLVIAYAALILAQAWLLGGRLLEYVRPDTVMAARLATSKDETLPESWGPFRGRASATKDDPSTTIGRYSRRWSYKWEGRTATVCLDGPFRGWHELPNCYLGQGWTVSGRSARPAEGPDGAVVEVKLDRIPEQRGDLFFGLTDEHGRPLAGPTEGGFFNDLLASKLEYAGLVPSPRSYQVQLLVVGGNPMTDAERSQALAFFKEARRLIQQADPAGKEGAR